MRSRAALVGAGLSALAACSQTADVGLARSGTRVGAEQLGLSEESPAASASGASRAPVLQLLGRPLLLVANEVSGSTTAYDVNL